MRHFMFTALLIVVSAPSFAQMAAGPPVVTGSYDLVGSAGVVHVDDMEINGHRETHFSVTSNHGIAGLTFDGRAIRFDDGYSIALTTLANTPDAFVARFTAHDPSGTSVAAILGKNLRTGEVTYAGVDDVVRFLRRSHDAQITGAVMRSLGDQYAPSLQGANEAPARAAGAHPGKAFKPAPTDCATSGVTLVISMGGVFTCPEGTITCIGGVVGVISSTYSLATGGCGYSIDDTIGWG